MAGKKNLGLVLGRGSKGYVFSRGTGSEFDPNEQYYYAEPYSCGYALVQKEKDGPYQYRDVYGNLSEELGYAESYKKGFAIVKRKSTYTSIYYRDMFGDIDGFKSEMGELFYKYYNLEISVYELPDECFLHDKFLQAMVRQEENMYLYACEYAKSTKELKEVKDHAETVAEYIKTHAYEVKQKYEDDKKRKEHLKKERAKAMDSVKDLF